MGSEDQIASFWQKLGASDSETAQIIQVLGKVSTNEDHLNVLKEVAKAIIDKNEKESKESKKNEKESKKNEEESKKDDSSSAFVLSSAVAVALSALALF